MNERVSESKSEKNYYGGLFYSVARFECVDNHISNSNVKVKILRRVELSPLCKDSSVVLRTVEMKAAYKYSKLSFKLS